jgi:hypothetical protein
MGTWGPACFPVEVIATETGFGHASQAIRRMAQGLLIHTR